ncbi:DnaB-like helicase C-terminal domain-containing protein [Phyllobacterium phragmitis]|nr:DnaB-like helicase C-terminal domain-containing protein [Phyllobacterium phragmitis]
MSAHAPDIRPSLPDAVEAEQALLGQILLDNAAYWRVAGFLKPQHFSEPLHSLVYEMAGTMIAEGRAVNPITIKQYLPASQQIGDSDLSIAQYMARLATEAVGSFSVYDYGRAILEIWARCQLVSLSQDLDTLSRTMPADMSPSKLIAEHTGHLVTISNEISEGVKAVTMADAVGTAVQSIDDAYKFKKPSGISTGIASVDQLTGPWESGQQIIIGGGTKQGKTALALQCSVGLAAHGTVWIYSGEMSVKQLAMREISRRTGIPVWRQKEGRISQAEWEKLLQVKDEVENLPILIEKRRLTLEQIHQVGREIKMERGLAAMVIDHVGLMAWGRDDARREEAALSAKATQGLKEIYEDLGVPGISLVQLKKNTFVQNSYGTARKSFEAQLRAAAYNRPKYTDLMGAVERDADHVLIPFNARPIIAGLEPEEGGDDYLLWETRMQEHEKKAEIILALSREHTFPQRREVEWHGETTSFGPAFVGRQESLLPEGF